MNSRARADGHDVIQHVTQLMTYPKGLRFGEYVGVCAHMLVHMHIKA